MMVEELREQLARTEATVALLQQELAQTNRGLVAMALELEQRLDERDLQLRASNAALEQSNVNLARTAATVRLLQEELYETNRGLIALNFELEQRVDARTAELRHLNQELEARVQERTSLLQQANDNLQNFAYTAAHDLRSPLRSMRAFADMASEEYGAQLDAEGQLMLKRISQSAAQMQQLLDDLLEYSKLNEQQLEMQQVRLQSAVREAIGMLEADIRTKGATVTVIDPLPDIVGHPATVVLLINNFISNALKFMAPGVQPKIQIWADPISATDPSADGLPQVVRLYVQDNGIGIDSIDQARIFGVFQRLHAKGTFPGTGLGLAIVRRGAERMGGRVGVESEPGKGSRFWIELPEAESCLRPGGTSENSQ